MTSSGLRPARGDVRPMNSSAKGARVATALAPRMTMPSGRRSTTCRYSAPSAAAGRIGEGVRQAEVVVAHVFEVADDVLAEAFVLLGEHVAEVVDAHQQRGHVLRQAAHAP